MALVVVGRSLAVAVCSILLAACSQGATANLAGDATSELVSLRLEADRADLLPGETGEIRAVATRAGARVRTHVVWRGGSPVAKVIPTSDSTARVTAPSMESDLLVEAEVYGTASVVATTKLHVRFAPTPDTLTAVTDSALTFTARSTIVPTSGLGAGPSVRRGTSVSTTVVIANPTDRTRTLALKGCALWLRAYRTPDRTSTPAWNQHSPGIICVEASRRIDLTSGASHTLTVSADGDRILGSLPAGRYFFAVEILLTDRVLVLPAGDGELTTGLEGLQYGGSIQFVPGTEPSLHATTEVLNPTPDSVQVSYGDCALTVLARPVSALDAPPVWNSAYSEPWGGVYLRACLMYLKVSIVPPNGRVTAREFTLDLPLVEMLADSLPDGRYALSARLGLNFLSSGEFPLGELDLSLPRPPLPSSQTRGTVQYDAHTELLPGSPHVVRTVVTATGVNAGAMLWTPSRDCAVVLYAYRDRARRDAAPRSGAPDWQPSTPCGPDVTERSLYKGVPVPLETRVSAASVLGSASAGHYFFAAVVTIGQRRVFVSAGEADLHR